MSALPTIRKLVFPLICLGLFPLQSVYAADAQNLAGAIVSVKGVATIDTGGTGARHPAKPGDSIFAHDVVTTAAGGAVKILLKDHSVVDLGTATVFKVDQYNPGTGSDREVVATLSQGTVRGAVTEKITGNGKFHLKTPTATMGVRGTEFVVDAPANRPGQPPQSSKITVLQGEVEVSHSAVQMAAAGGGPARGASVVAPVMVLKAGQQVTAIANTPLPAKPITLDVGSLGKVAGASKVADNTFTRSVVIDTSSNGANATSTGQSGSSSAGQRAPASQPGGSPASPLNNPTGPVSDPLPLPPVINQNAPGGPPGPPLLSSTLTPVNTVHNAFSTVTISIH